MRLSIPARLLLFFLFFGVFLNLVFWYQLVAQPFLPKAPPAAKNGRIAKLVSPSQMFEMVNGADRVIQKLKANSDSRERELRRLANEGYRIDFQNGALQFRTEGVMTTAAEAQTKGIPFPPIPEFKTGRDTEANDYISWEFGGESWALTYPAGYSIGLWQDPMFRSLLIGQAAVMLFLCLAFALWQLRPLRRLMSGAMELAKGNFQHRVKVTQKSELGEFADVLNGMAGKISGLMRSKDELLVAISHELRSPLTRMRLALEVEGEKSLPRIRHNIGIMEKLIGELLESSRMDHHVTVAKKERVDVVALFDRLAREYELQSQELRFRIEGSPVALGDEDRLYRVLVNGIENALKYSVGTKEPTVVRACMNSGKVEFTIADRGPGIPPELLERVFEPFFRVDESRDRATGGYGLGLSLCRKMLEMQGGEIRATNREGGGFALFFTLPAYRPES